MSTEEKIKILSGVNTVEFFVRSKAMDFVDTVSNIHPLLRLYFDSDLSSDIENNSILAITTAIEKCIGAFRNGIKKIIIPKDNMRDLDEIPLELKEKIKFIPVSNYKEVFKIINKKVLVES